MRRIGAAYRTAVTIVRPPLMLLTKREWHGAERLPRTDGFVACVNHVSHLDPFTFAHVLDDHGVLPRSLAEESVFRIPVLGRIVAGAEATLTRDPGLHLLPPKTMHGWAGPPVDLARFHGGQHDQQALREATDAILDAITDLLEQIRGERRPAQRWDPREHDVPRTGNPKRQKETR